MKNTSKYFAIGSAIVAAGTAALVAVIKRRSKDESSASYEEELAEIQLKHAAEMAELEEIDKKNKAEHENRMASIRKAHDEIMIEIEKIREELLNNVELRKSATPEESKTLDERDMELLKKLYELK